MHQTPNLLQRQARGLTDNGKEFTDRLFASREREPSGEHEFDRLCTALGIEHRLIYQTAATLAEWLAENFPGVDAELSVMNELALTAKGVADFEQIK